MPDKSWVKFDKKLSVKQQSESLGFVTQVLTVNWLSFRTIKKHFWAFYQSQKIVLEERFFIFFSSM